MVVPEVLFSLQNKEEAAHHLSRMLFLALTLGLGLLIVTEVWVTELLQGTQAWIVLHCRFIADCCYLVWFAWELLLWSLRFPVTIFWCISSAFVGAQNYDLIPAAKIYVQV